MIEYSTITGCISQSASIKNMRQRDKINLLVILMADLGITEDILKDKDLSEKFDAMIVKYWDKEN